jgi:hypothetical protein
MRYIAVALLTAWLAAGAAAKESAPAAKLSAAQIVDRNVNARGGLEAWRKIQSMVWVGRMESADAPVPSMPFVLQQQRPNKTRFELTAQSQTSLRIFDGAQGWKMHGSRDGHPGIQPFTAQELQFAQEGQGIDGPLIDYQAKGIAIALEGVEQVEGRDAYRLSVRLPSGTLHHVWVDAKTFLDVKYDRISYNAAGVPGPVSVFYRSYQAVEGLQIPSVLEIGVGSGKVPDRMTIERIALNPPLDERTFARPGTPRQRSAAPPAAQSSQPAAAPDAGSDPR